MPFCGGYQPTEDEMTIDLLPFEQDKNMGEMDGIVVVSIFKTNSSWSTSSYEKIKNRMVEIFKKNPFLMGKLVLESNPAGFLKPKRHTLVLKSFEQDDGDLEIETHIRNNHIFEKVMDDISLGGDLRAKSKIWTENTPGMAFYGYDQNNLANFTIFRDAENVDSSRKIAIVYSIGLD